MQVDLTLKRVLLLAGGVLALALALAIAFTVYRRGYESRILQLQNDVAARDQTIEVRAGEFQKLDLQTKDLSALLGNKDQQLVDLQRRLDSQGAQLLTANTLVVQLKQKLSQAGTTTIVVQPPTPGGETPLLFSNEADEGPFHIQCNTFLKTRANADGDFVLSRTAQPGFVTTLTQPRPWKLSVLVSQDRDGTWRTSTTSSEKDFQVDIALAGVNPYLLEPHRYEKVALDAEIGIGTNPGFLAGVGASYEIGHFEVGPKVWVVLDHGVSPYFGAALAWHPFAK
jgi:hypothetical protein